MQYNQYNIYNNATDYVYLFILFMESLFIYLSLIDYTFSEISWCFAAKQSRMLEGQ